jgi:hypothetical protein
MPVNLIASISNRGLYPGVVSGRGAAIFLIPRKVNQYLRG